MAFNNCRIAWQYSFLLIPESEQSVDVRKMENIERLQWTAAAGLSHLCVLCRTVDQIFSLPAYCSSSPLSLRQVGREDVIVANVSLTFLPPSDRRQTNSLYCSYIKCSQYELKPELVHVLPGNVPLTSCATVIRHSSCPAKCDRGQCACSSNFTLDLV